MTDRTSYRKRAEEEQKRAESSTDIRTGRRKEKNADKCRRAAMVAAR
jgi:hypothetical protein